MLLGMCLSIVLRVAAGALAAVAALALINGSALAGAFLQKPDEGIVIVGGAFTDAVRAYDAAGRLVPVSHWRKFELTSYAEYGVTDWLTVVASPSLFAFRQGAPYPNHTAAGVGEAGARIKALEWGTSVLSGQVIVRAPLGGGRSARPFVDTTRFVQVDARVGWGNGFELFGLRAFTDLQVGFRSAGNFGHEGRIDGTLGVWAFEPLLLLFQTFSAFTPGQIGRSLFLSEKVQVSAVYWLTPTLGIQAGGLLGLRGINSGAERGAFSALWVRF